MGASPSTTIICEIPLWARHDYLLRHKQWKMKENPKDISQLPLWAKHEYCLQHPKPRQFHLTPAEGVPNWARQQFPVVQ